MFSDLHQFSLFGIKLIDFNMLGNLGLKLLIDLVFTLIIIRWIFFPIYRETDYLFTAFVINVVVFTICFFLANFKVDKGFSFGLFAVLSIVRYRTEQIPIRQMTYMFAAIIIGVINALSGKIISFTELIIVNSIIAIAIYLLERTTSPNGHVEKTIKYGNMDLIKPARYQELLADLKERTGLPITRVEVANINLMNNSAEVRIHYERGE